MEYLNIKRKYRMENIEVLLYEELYRISQQQFDTGLVWFNLLFFIYSLYHVQIH